MATIPKRTRSAAFTLHMHDLRRFSCIDPGEEVALAQRIERGDRAAREALICANFRLVYFIAKGYVRTAKYSCHGLDFLDLLQEGYAALIRAVDHWDWRLGYKFGTYATWWIRGAIRALVGEWTSTISTPNYVAEHRWKVKAALNSFLSVTDRPPRLSEIAKQAGLGVEDVKRVMAYERIMPASLDAAIENQAQWAERLAVKELGPEQRLIQSFVKSRISSIVDTVGQRAAYILRLRCGLEDGTAYTLEAIAAMFGLTRERIRQIEKKALATLRETYGPELRTYLSLELRQSEVDFVEATSRAPKAAVRVQHSGRKGLHQPKKNPLYRGQRHSAKWYVRKLQAIADRIGHAPSYVDLVAAFREGYGFDHEELYDHFQNINAALEAANLV